MKKLMILIATVVFAFSTKAQQGNFNTTTQHQQFGYWSNNFNNPNQYPGNGQYGGQYGNGNPHNGGNPYNNGPNHNYGNGNHGNHYGHQNHSNCNHGNHQYSNHHQGNGYGQGNGHGHGNHGQHNQNCQHVSCGYPVPQVPVVCTPPPVPNVPVFYGPRAMESGAFQSLKASINNQWFSSGQMDVFRQAVQNNYFTAQQVSELVALFTFSSDRLNVAKQAYTKTIDPENYFVVSNQLEYSSSVRDLTAYIASL